MSEKPVKISVIVPVYNTKKYIEMCITSLLAQTMKEFEVVVIDDGSTDGSGEIMDEYAKKYPEIIKVMHIENGGQGRARNIGIQRAVGEYIAFCDSDDFFAEKALETMYKVVEKEQCELVYTPEYRVRGKNKYILGQMQSPVTKESLLLNMSIFTLHGILVKRELLLSVGEMPNIVYEDTAYVPVLISKAEKVGYCKTPVYHYIERDDSTIFKDREAKILDFTKAVDFTMSHVEKQYYDEVLMAMLQKEAEKVRTIWYFGDIIIEHLKTYKTQLEQNRYYLENPEKYKILNTFMNLPVKGFENNLYINDFQKNRKKQHFMAFRKEENRVLLDGENCDLHCNKKIEKLWNEEEYETIASYFAMKKIYEDGGVYVSNQMEITGAFDTMKYFSCFFGYKDSNSISDKVFGGIAGNQPMKLILEKFEEENEKSMEECIEQVFIENYGVELNGETSYAKYEMVLLAPTAIIVNMGKRITLTEQKIYDAQEEVVTVPRNTLNFMYQFPTGWQSTQIKNEKFKNKELSIKNQELREKNKELKEKNKEVTQKNKEITQKNKENQQEIKELEKEKKKLLESREYNAGMELSKSKIGRAIIKWCLRRKEQRNG